MERRLRRCLLALAAATAAGALLALAPPQPAAHARAVSDPRLVSLKNQKKKIHGLTPAQWTAEWWQWACSMPVAMNPGFDTTGDRTYYGQRGPVWFLVGAFMEAAVVNRSVTIPKGKTLLIPLLNVMWDNVGTDPPHDVPRLRELAAEYMANATEISCEIDGVAVPAGAITRIRSPEFQYAFTEDNFGLAFGQGTLPGIYAPAVSDGYWVMLKPLPVGTHTIRSRGRVDQFQLDVSYEITVVDHESFPSKSAR